MNGKSSFVACIPVDVFVFGFRRNGSLWHIPVGWIVAIGFELGVFLVLPDEFDADLPKLDVTPDKKGEDHQAEQGTDVICNHQQPVEQSMGGYSGEKTQQQETEMAFVAEFCQREEIAHDYAKQKVSGNGE